MPIYRVLLLDGQAIHRMYSFTSRSAAKKKLRLLRNGIAMGWGTRAEIREVDYDGPPKKKTPPVTGAVPEAGNLKSNDKSKLALVRGGRQQK